MKTTGVRMEGVSAAYDSKKPKNEKVGEEKELAEKEWELALLKSQLNEAERRIRQLSGRQKSDVEETSMSSLLCLKRIDFECKPGELIAIVGGVGCGKSSFINALLGEVRQLSGTTAVKGKLAYFSQSPFIMNASIRDNIIFGHIGEAVDEALYQRALDCCALRHDLEMMPDGDSTEIGERGVTLSGGQKARVALARAVYHGADITLIDDALSAVDAHVAEHLFEEAIVGELMKRKSGTDRSVILVTNAIQYLKHNSVSKIVVIQDGRIVEEGTYRSLSSDKASVFSRFLAVISETSVSGHGSPKPQSFLDVITSPLKPKQKPASSPVVKEGTKVEEKVAKKLMVEETRQTGHVSLGVYVSWSRAAGGLWVPLAILLSFAVGESLNVLSNWWLTFWSSHGSAESQASFLATYALINLLVAIVGLGRMLLVSIFGLKASRKVRTCFG